MAEISILEHVDICIGSIKYRVEKTTAVIEIYRKMVRNCAVSYQGGTKFKLITVGNR